MPTTQPTNSIEHWIVVIAAAITAASVILVPAMLILLGKIGELRKAASEAFAKNAEKIQAVAQATTQLDTANRQVENTPDVEAGVSNTVANIARNPDSNPLH